MEDSPNLVPGLYIVATPIGNLEDITLRALRVLKSVDQIVCESARHSQKLLAFYQIDKPLTTYNEHASIKTRQRLVENVCEGQRLALISDAGMPLLSDPGYKLVQAFHENDLFVTVIPGASASLTALVASGFPTDRFFVQGFLPMKGWRGVLENLVKLEATLVFFESPRRIKATLDKMHDVFGRRPFVVMRELTKVFESRWVGYLGDAELLPTIKGEVVIIVGGATGEPSEVGLKEHLQGALKTLSLKESVALVCRQTGLSRKQVYAEALRLSGGK